MTEPKERKPRRQRADSTESAVATYVARAVRQPRPPKDIKMDPTDLLIFNEIVDEFAAVDWTDHSVRIAALLARTMHDMQSDQQDLRREGSVIDNASGNPVMNPRRTACQGYASMITQMRRTLALHATAGSSKADTGRRRIIHKDQEKDSPLGGEDGGEDLIAVPGRASGRPRLASVS